MAIDSSNPVDRAEFTKMASVLGIGAVDLSPVTNRLTTVETSQALDRAALPLTPIGDTNALAAQGFYNFNNPTNLNRWKTALGNSRAGVSNAVVAFVGDSNTSGHGAGLSTEATGYTQASNRNVTNTFARLMNNGNPVGESFTGTLNLTLAQWAFPFDSRVSIGSGWALGTALNPTIGGYLWSSPATNTGLTPIIFTPKIPYNQIDIWAPANSASLANFSVTKGGSALGTVNNTNATPTYTKTQFSPAALSTDAIAVAPATAAQAYLGQIVTRDTTRTGVEVLNWAFDGGRATVNYTFGGQIWEHTRAAATVKPDLIVLQLGINDINQNATDTAFTASMTSLINSYKVNSDVILCTFFPIVVGADGGTNNTAARNALFFAAMYNLAKNLNVPLIDHTKRLGGLNNFTALSTAGLTFDNNHMSASGYAFEAAAVEFACKNLA